MLYSGTPSGSVNLVDRVSPFETACIGVASGRNEHFTAEVVISKEKTKSLLLYAFISPLCLDVTVTSH